MLQIAQQVENLRADRDVQRRHRLVADDQLGLDRERAGDGNALALAAGKFVRVAARKTRLEADQLQQFLDPRAVPRPRHQVMQLERLAQDLADGHPRIERGVGILKDDLRLAAEAAELLGIHRQQIAAFEADAAGVGLDQPQHQPAHRRLAAAGLADQRQRLAGLDNKTHAVDGVDMGGRPPEYRALRHETPGQILDLEQSRHDTSLSSGALMQRDQ